MVRRAARGRETDAKREESFVTIAKRPSAGNPAFLGVTQKLLSTFPAYLVRGSKYAEWKVTASQDE